MTKLTRLELSGWKSIGHRESLELGPVNVLIGANGAGKSNLISFFRLLNWMTPPPGNLQLYLGRAGGANALLHDGAAATPHMDASLTFETERGHNDYHLRLFYAAGDSLVFADEKYRFRDQNYPHEVPWTSLGAGHRESGLIDAAQQGDTTARVIHGMLRRCVVYQFHNTSERARVRQRWDVEDNRFLKEDGANLAPFLLRLRETHPRHYGRIVDTIRQVAPFFADFELEPTNGTLLLQWREGGSDVVFGAHQASDGTLRLMALIALLLQPRADLPSVIILDEPELGLHPFAVGVVAGLFRSVAFHTQVILATQSSLLVDYFDPEQILVVERPERSSSFRRLDGQRLAEWLEEYSVAQLWEKNVLGGTP